ncbi:MAG: hypothetical protein JXA06_13360 [Bacteroidetes bacterium]|nr:hypothetical protein [Bacteroidota bacterium]
MKKTLSFFLAGILSIALFISPAYAQVSQYVVDVKIPEAIEKMPLPLSVQLTQNTQIQRVLLHYREFGKTEYKQADMLLSGRTASATIPAKSVIAPYIEYYISMQLANNKQATFPSESPRSNPLKIQVKELDEKDMEVRFLSPEPGETLAAEDLAVAVSLMYTSDAVDTKNTRIYLDGVDVTDEAIIADDVLLYNPANFKKPLSLGSHSIKIELRDTLGKAYYTKHQEFNLSTATAIEMEKAKLQYNGNAQAEFRNEKIDDKSTNYIRGDVHLGSVYKDYTFSGDVHLTNEEKSYLQPQNRFLAAIQAADIAKVQVGDAYPQFPSLFVSGKRVRGVTGSVTLGYFNLDVSYGKTDRSIEGTLGSLIAYADSSAAASRAKETVFERFGGQNPDYATPMDTLFYRMFTSGTFSRNIFAIRPSFGSGENFQFGLTYLKSKDDKASIKYGTYPKENVVAGADLLLAFDDQRVRWASQAAMSLENNDITIGSYTDEEIDEFKGVNDPTKTPEQRQKAQEEADDLKKIAKTMRSFITVNADLSPLDPIKGMPSLAFESELSLNYFNNYIRAMLFRRGISYSSYGNDFIQNDIAGFNISDRVRFLQNKIIASISYENKWNNTQNEAGTPTTSYNTFNTYVTAYPGINLPSFTIGYGLYTRKNPIELNTNSSPLDSILVANESTNRFFLSSNYDFHMLVRNSLSASLSIANKKDNTFYKRDQDNVNFSALVVSSFSIPLQTTFGFIINHTAAYSMPDTSGVNATTTQKFDYQTLTLGARYRLLDDRLNLLATIAPSFGDFKRLLMQAGAEYQVMENHYLVSQFDFIDNSGRASDTIFSILYRFMF